MTIKNEKDTSGEVSIEILPQNNQNFNIEALISQGIDKGLSVDTMERLLAMRKELKNEWAKEQFNKDMSAFQAECPVIEKTKSVPTKTGQIAYKYAPIESIVGQVKGLLEKYGFSYSTTMEVLANGVKACVKVTHRAGHSEESCMQVPLGQQTQIMSASQQTAAAQTFAKRYAFCNAFGILTGDEDNDGAIIETAQQHTPQQSIKTQYKAPTGDTQPTEKQKQFIKTLCQQKGVSEAGLRELAITYKGNPSGLIEFLLKYQKPKEDLSADPQMSEEDQKLVDSVPF